MCDSVYYKQPSGKYYESQYSSEDCEAKIAAKGQDVGVSFYAFFANKNDDPELLMEVAEWWIMEMKLEHFEKARKIIYLV